MTSDEWREETRQFFNGTLVHAHVPYGTSKIGYGCFNGCATLQDVDIPSSVTSYDALAFGSCGNLTSHHIPSNVLSLNSGGIGGGAFNNTGLVSIQIDYGVKTMGVSTFQGCSRLLKCTIPDSVTSLGERTFGGCSALQELTIGSGIPSISTYTIKLNSLRILTFKRTTPPSIATNAFSGSARGDLVIYVPSDSVDAYKSALSFNATLQGKVTANPNE